MQRPPPRLTLPTIGSVPAEERRRFLQFASGSVGLGVLFGCGGGAGDGLLSPQAVTTPDTSTPSTPGSASGSPTPVPVGDGPVFDGPFQVQLTLTSTVSGSSIPWYCAQPCAKGHLPAGSVITVPGENMQAHVESTWPDGSARVVVLTGYRDFSANSPVTLTLLGGANPDGPALNESTLSTAQATVSYGSYGSLSLSALVGTSALVRTRFMGPRFAEFHYWAPFPSDPDLVAWFYCKVWNNGRYHVRVRVENGRNCSAADAPAKSGTATVVVDNLQRFNGALTTHPWCGWDVEAFNGAAGIVRPAHDMNYLRATRLIPNLAPPAPPRDTALRSLVQVYSPGSQPNLTTSMGSGGADSTIGLLTRVDALYVTSNGDGRAFDAMVAAGRGAASYPILRRDPASKRPYRISAYPTLKKGDLSDAAYTPRAVAPTHMPTFGYMAYLTTGEYQFLETVQHTANMHWYLNNNGGIGGASETGINRIIFSQIRGRGWWVKQMALSIAVSPTGDAVGADHKAHLETNLEYFDSAFVAPDTSPLGCFSGGLTNDAETGIPKTQLQSWQYDFFTASVGWARDLELGLSARAANQLAALSMWSFKSITGRLGAVGDPSAYDFRFAGKYQSTFSDAIIDRAPASSFYKTWRQVFENTVRSEENQTPLPVIAATINNSIHDGVGTLRDIGAGWATDYVANYLPALAYAVDYGAPGAAEGHSRVVGADNWNSIFSNFQDEPQWAIMPRDR